MGPILGYIALVAVFLLVFSSRAEAKDQGLPSVEQWAHSVLGGLREHLPLAYALVDSKGRVLGANREACDFLGLKTDEFVGRDIRNIPVEGRIIEVIRRIYQQIKVFETVQHELSIKGRTYRLTIIPLGNRRERILTGVLALGEDMSAAMANSKKRMTVKKSLLTLEERFLILGPQAQVIFDNRLPETCVGKPFAQVDDSPLTQVILEAFAKRARLCQAVETEGTKWVLKCRPLREKREFLGILCTVTEQTQVLRENEAYQRAKQLGALGELACSTAHELRNPLAAIRGLAQLSLALNDPKQSREAFDEIIKQIDQINGFIEDLLFLARPGQGEREAVCISEMVEGVLRLFRGQILMKKIRVKTQVQGGVVWGHRKGLTQALINLVTNSIQAMSEGGDLTITGWSDDGNAYLEVEDTGGGIPPEVMGRLFTPFLTTKEKGSGLGLAITHQIVTGHGGTLEVRSQVGLGTRICMVLPAHE